MIFYEDELITQASTGPDGTANCFAPEFVFDKSTRKNLFGEAENELRLSGLPGFGEYDYTSYGAIFLKRDKELFSAWFSNGMSYKQYLDTYVSENNFRINLFRYNPAYDKDGNILPPDEEE
ncbi:MAG: hypothetical protein ACOCXT_03090 [Candidatus Dojkabacteria bacterium]